MPCPSGRPGKTPTPKLIGIQMASRQWAGGVPTPGLLRCESLLPSSRWARCRHGDLQGLSFLEEGPLSSGRGPGWRDESQLMGAEGWKHLHWSLHPELTAGAEDRLLSRPPMSWSLIRKGYSRVFLWHLCCHQRCYGQNCVLSTKCIH